MNTFQLMWRLVRFRLWFFVTICFIFAGWYVVPVGTGLVIRIFFNQLSQSSSTGWDAWTGVALFVGIAAGRAILYWLSIVSWIEYWFSISALLRKNLLAWILDRPGAQAFPGSPGEAINHFRDDVQTIIDNLASYTDVVSQVALAGSALTIMLNINWQLTLVALVPIGVIVALTYVLNFHVTRYRRESRKVASRLNGFIGESISLVEAVKIASAEGRVIKYFQMINEARRQAAVKDQLLVKALDALNMNVTTLVTGIILLMGATLMRAGTFTVGDFALFVSYLGLIARFPRLIGRLWAFHKQSGVSFDRLLHLMQAAPAQALVKHVPLYFRKPYRDQANASPAPQLRKLEVKGLTYRYPKSEIGIREIDLSVERGSCTVITGRIGAGKTTLLRVLLGLLPKEAGQIYWNNQLVDKPSSFFLPPCTAYVPQVPRLFSESLQDNILLGMGAEKANLGGVIQSVVFEQDIAEMPEGLETVIGPRGMRLSGGQIQRVAVARSLIRDPELLILDDPSSALDAETEQLLLKRLLTARDSKSFTCIIASHRPSVLRQADQILVLRDGQVEAKGTWDELIKSSLEFQKLWSGQIS